MYKETKKQTRPGVFFELVKLNLNNTPTKGEGLPLNINTTNQKKLKNFLASSSSSSCLSSTWIKLLE